MREMGLLAGRVSPAARIELLSSGKTADGARVYAVSDGVTSVLKVSPPAFPGVIREMTQKAKLAREVLGEELGHPIPEPVDQWESDGVSCALFEWLIPISDRRLRRFYQLRRITSPVLTWLRQIAELDGGANEEADACLQALAECPFERLRGPAENALIRTRTGVLVLRSRVMHGDLWIGNVLIDPNGDQPFMVIDWRGSNVDGFPIFDLVKFAESAGLKRRVLKVELAAHATRLSCDIQDTRTYFLAALGYIWRHLDQLPPERFAAMAEANLSKLDAALDG